MLIAACGENKSKKTSFSTDDYLHVVDLKNVSEIPLSAVFASVSPIVLETTKNSLIGDISKVIATPEYLIVFDKGIAKALFLFKKDGTFVHKFGRIGGGPGEYTNIYDFCYDKATCTIYMLCDNGRVNLYDIHTGSFLKSIQLQNHNSFSADIYYHGGELYTTSRNFANKNERYLLSKRNQKTGEIEKSWFDFETYSKNIENIGLNPFLFGDDKSFKFNTSLMDGIMQVENGKITPFLTFNPEFLINTDDLKVFDSKAGNINVHMQGLSLRKLFGVFEYCEHKDLILMRFFSGPQIILYNQKTKESKSMPALKDALMFKDDILSFPGFTAQDDNGVYLYKGSNLTASKIKEYLENDLITENFKSSAIELSNLEEDTNPFLFYYEFKD